MENLTGPSSHINIEIKDGPAVHTFLSGRLTRSLKGGTRNLKKGFVMVLVLAVVLVVLMGIGAALIGNNQSGNSGTQGDQSGTSSTASTSGQTQLKVSVDYGSHWTAAIAQSDNANGSVSSGSQSYDGTGHQEYVLTQPSGASVWTVAATGSKPDTTNDTLTVRIMNMDGMVLKEGSTSASYGATFISYTMM
jgi:cytoskeletal protein RodZ